MKRLHKNMVTAGVLLAGGIGIGLYTLEEKVKTPEERFRDAQEGKRLHKFGRIDVVNATLHAKNATISFARDGNAWKLTKPAPWPADGEAIDAMLDRMAALVVDPVITEEATEEDLKRAGLDKPIVSLSVELNAEKGGRTLTLNVAKRNKLEDKYPVTDGEKKRIGLSEPTFFWSMDCTFDELRDKHLVPFRKDAVTKIQVLEPDGTTRFILEKKGEDEWVTSGPGQEPIAADSGGALLFSVRVSNNLKAESFVTDEYDPATKKYGFDAPKATLIVTGPTEHRIMLAVPQDRKDVCNAHLEGTGTVVETSLELIEYLNKKPLELRDRTLHRFNVKDVKVVRFIASSHGEIVVTRSDGGGDWTIGDDKKPAKIWKIDGIVRAYSYLKVDAIHAVGATKAQLVEWLLEPPSRRLVFENAGGDTLADIRIGKYGTDTQIFIRDEGDDRIGLVSDKRIDMLPKKLEDLIDEER